MKFQIKPLIVLLIFFVLVSCKKDESLSEYKYSSNEFQVSCEGVNPELLKEAVYSFEEDINNYFAQKGTKNLSQAYSRAVNLGIYGRAKYEEIASPHTIEIFEILKKDKTLWNLEGETNSLNYDNPFVTCLAENLTNKDLQTTFKALLSTNSMSANLFGEPLKRTAYLAIKDKYLATYIALDMYYAKLFDVDFSKKETNKVADKPEDTK